MMKRVLIMVTDSLGIGHLPDAGKYFNSGVPDDTSDTLGHILEKYPGMRIPNLSALGIGKIDGVSGHVREKYGSAVFDSTGDAFCAYGRMAEKSKGKDTITGHWEIAGLYTEVPFKTYPDGFPEEFISEFEKAIGRKTLGNYAASGTVIIEDLGKLHEETGSPIVYTSADSVFQIAANTDVIPLDELYRICETARKMLVGSWACGRVIARPYVIEDGKRVRTSDRKDYAVSPPQNTLLDIVSDAGKTVYAIGKINDIFNGCGVTRQVHTESNMDGCDKTIEALREDFEGLIFTNLVDFDSKYGHRRDPKGYAEAIEAFDERLPDIFSAMKDTDILIICADHGNDPTYAGWDHTREYIPVLVYGKDPGMRSETDLGTGSSYADIGATAADILGVEPTEHGKSFLPLIRKK